MTDAELDEMPLQVEWLVRDFISLGQPLIMGGKSKTLKTSLMLYIAVCLVHGLPVCGEFTVPEPVPVTVFSGESGKTVIKDTLARIRESLHVRTNGFLHITASLPNLNDNVRDESIRMLERTVRQHGSKLVVIDPAYLCFGGDDAANLFKMGERLRPLSEVCERQNCTLALIHHLKKNSGMELDPPEREDLAFAGFSEFAAQWLLLGRREPYVDGSGHHQLWMRFGGRAGHEGLRGLDIRERCASPVTLRPAGSRIWQIASQRSDEVQADVARSRARAKDAKAAQELADLKSAILQAYSGTRDTTATWTAKEVKARTGSSKGVQKIKQALLSLVEDGTLIARETRRSGNETEEYLRP